VVRMGSVDIPQQNVAKATVPRIAMPKPNVGSTA
jgi:hypothetical protein